MKTNNLAFIRYLNKNEVVKSYLIVFFNKKTMMVHKDHSTDRAADSVRHNRKLLLRLMIEKFPGKCCFPLSILVSSIKFRLRNSDVFVGLHCLHYSSVGLSILTNCAKVPGLCPAWGGRVVR